MFSDRTFIIAEAGVNHNGDRERALELVRVAAASGADAVKFQSFKADRLTTADARKAAYQEAATGAGQLQYEMLKALELGEETELEIAAECRRHGISFMSTPFDEASADFLVRETGMEIVKIGSGDLTNAPLLLHVARLGKSVILSTGMATIDEIAEALAVLVFGLENSRGFPSREDVDALKRAGKFGKITGKVALLHCTTEYPAPLSELNLRAIPEIQKSFGLTVGYSDHSTGVTIPAAAVAMGAAIIEKHFTLDRSLPGPDHRASLEPAELAEMVKAIRDVEAALGDGKKMPSPAELKNRDIARRSVVAAKEIKAGELFSETNLTIKRPGTGLRPIELWDRIGKKAKRNYQADEAIDP
jgi:N-acetylneuraminate synthase